MSVSKEAIEAAVEEIRKVRKTPVWDRWTDHDAIGAVLEAALPFLSSPGKDGGQEVEATQITMCRGLVDVSRIEHEGSAGILFRPRADHIPVGEEGELQAGEYWPVKGDVVIWIENEGGARVIETYLSAFLPTQPASTALVERLTSALQPFAQAADDIERTYGNDLPEWQIQFPQLPMSDFRRARSALSASTSREGESRG